MHLFCALRVLRRGHGPGRAWHHFASCQYRASSREVSARVRLCQEITTTLWIAGEEQIGADAYRQDGSQEGSAVMDLAAHRVESLSRPGVLVSG